VKDSRARFANWIASVIGTLPMRRVQSTDLEEIVRKLDRAVQERADWFEEHGDESPSAGRRPGLAWKTAWNIWGEVTDAFREACTSKLGELKVRDDNPATNVQGPDRGDDREKPILYPSEFLALVSCERVPLSRRQAYAVAVYLAGRANELAALGPADVDTEHRRIRINKQVDRKTGEMRPTKTKRQRLVEIEREIAPLLDVLVSEANERLLDLPPDEDRAELPSR
jgi:integrase